MDIKTGSDICELGAVGGPVVHLAAVSSIPASFDDITETMRTNIYGLASVIEACKYASSKLIFASSSSVLDPQSPYAWSKLWGEQLIRDSGVDHAILRLGNVYGEGDTKSAIYHFLTDDEITINGDGRQVRSFIHVDDVVAAIQKALEDDWCGTFNIGHENHDLLSVARMFKKPKSFGPPRRGDAPNTAFEQYHGTPTIKLEEWIAAQHA